MAVRQKVWIRKKERIDSKQHEIYISMYGTSWKGPHANSLSLKHQIIIIAIIPLQCAKNKLPAEK